VMDAKEVEAILSSAEEALDSGQSIRSTGYWRAVSSARSDRQIAETFADRMAAIDKRAFERAVRPRVSEAMGTSVLAMGTLAGIAVLMLSDTLENRVVRNLALLGAFGALEVSTHSLTHWIVGRLVGIKFTHYFIGGPPPPRPGAKIDYASYLRTPPARRALMHASGAVVTKVVPFAFIPVALKLEAYRWVIYLLVGVGFVQILTDIMFSTKTSDWKKVRRELRARERWGRS
jgi:hypothetical protein